MCIGSGALAATVSPNATGFALGDNGGTLLTIPDLNAPGVAAGTALTKSTGGGLSLSALAYRPQTGQMYGYSDQDDTVYLLDVDTGVGTAQATEANATNVETLGFDFNNQVDAARILTTADRNYVFDPKVAPPTLTRVTDLFYVAGDLNEGSDPNIIGNAYTNAVPDASTTLQFGLDSQQDVLTTVGNNAGTLTTVGQLFFEGAPLDIGTDGGFDILSFAEGDNTALAILTAITPTFAGQGLFLLPLMADVDGRINVELVGATSRDFGTLDGFAVAPNTSAVPVPASLPLFLSAMVGLGLMGRRRKRAA
ncbi:MAG: DUF4394 domain-containing protein [Alphaproteobacteria bacterium]